jgi:hypothetical protein
VGPRGRAQDGDDPAARAAELRRQDAERLRDQRAAAAARREAAAKEQRRREEAWRAEEDVRARMLARDRSASGVTPAAGLAEAVQAAAPPPPAVVVAAAAAAAAAALTRRSCAPQAAIARSQPPQQEPARDDVAGVRPPPLAIRALAAIRNLLSARWAGFRSL